MVPLLSTSPDATGGRGAVERVEYLIERCRVAYEFGGGAIRRPALRIAGFEHYLLRPIAPRDLSDLMETPS